MNSVSTYVFPEFCQPTSHQHSLQKAWTNLPLPGQQLYSPVLEKGWTPWIIKTPGPIILEKMSWCPTVQTDVWPPLWKMDPHLQAQKYVCGLK